MKHWPIIAISLLTISTSPLHAAADSARPGTPGPTGTTPDFKYRSIEGGWKFMHDLRLEGHVLIVLEPADAQLMEIQREAKPLRRQDVMPVAVFRRSESENWSAIERLHLTYSLLSDPGGVLAAQFQGAEAVDTPHPAWFLVDRDGHVAALDRGAFPGSSLASVVETVLHSREGASAVRP